jgi:hypothetical protein
MAVYSYIVTHDTGFAPNPFHGFLTLACCKPVIRRTAQVSDWVVGLSPGGARVVYAMRVSETMPFERYWADPRFAAKRPDMASTLACARRGDNIYEPVAPAQFRQLTSRHAHRDGTENPKTKDHDLRGVHVLVAEEFVYFGGTGPAAPPEMAFLRVGRGHRSRFTPEQVETAVRWLSGLPRGIRGCPTDWPSGDHSWRA